MSVETSGVEVCGRCGSPAARMRSDPRWIDVCADCHEELIEQHGEPSRDIQEVDL